MDDLIFKYVVWVSALPISNLKLPSEIKPGASWFTTIDRRLSKFIRPKVKTGATVKRGTIGRVKYVGRYGTAAVVTGTFATAYSVTTMFRCYLEC